MQNDIFSLVYWANKVLETYLPQFDDSRAVDDCLVGLAAAVSQFPIPHGDPAIDCDHAQAAITCCSKCNVVLADSCNPPTTSDMVDGIFIRQYAKDVRDTLSPEKYLVNQRQEMIKLLNWLEDFLPDYSTSVKENSVEERKFYVGFLQAYAEYFNKKPENRERGIHEAYLRGVATEMLNAAAEIERLQLCVERYRADQSAISHQSAYIKELEQLIIAYVKDYDYKLFNREIHLTAMRKISNGERS